MAPYWSGQLNIAFKDSMAISRTVVPAFNHCDPNYPRYFNKKGAVFSQPLRNYDITNLKKHLTSANMSGILPAQP